MTKKLSPELKDLALEDLKRSGLDKKDFEKMKLSVFNQEECRKLLNKDHVEAGYKIPYFKPNCSSFVETDDYRVRYVKDLPSAGFKSQRYDQLKGTEPKLYFPPNLDFKILADKHRPLTITEGEKKSYAATKKGIPTIGLSGVWSFKCKRLGMNLIDDFKHILLDGREVTLCFDNDVKSNPHVMQALQELAGELERKGAMVKIKYLPFDPYNKIGLDDYLLDHNKNDFDNLPNEDPLHPEIRKLNNELAVVPVGSKILILREEVDPNFPDNKIISLYRPSEMTTLYANLTIPANVNGNIKQVPVFKLWLENKTRRTLKGIVFDPDDERIDYYNLYSGLAVVPKKGCWKKLKKHILENICQGNKNIFNYVIAWMADAIQNPSKRPGVAIVLRGRQGCGKGIFVNTFGQLFGQHFIRLDDSGQLLGQFNFHLKDKLIIFADEAFWAGDQKSEGKIKGLITEPTLQIEGKFKDSFSIKNHTRLMIASNSEWTCPAGLEERRFCVLDVGEKHMQDQKYFGAIVEEINSGGLEAFLHDLVKFDLSGINLNDFPKTDALLEQKIHSMDSVEQFYFNVLKTGDLNNKGDWNNGLVKCKVLQKRYVDSSKDIGVTRRASETAFGIKLKKLCPKLKKKRVSVELKKLCSKLKKKRVSVEVPTKQEAVYLLPDLHTCRTHFETLIGTEIDWDSFDA